MKTYEKIHKFSGVISYFALKTWTFRSENVRNLITHMSERDREIFYSDLKNLNWDEFHKAYFKGIRVYLIKDPLETLEAAKKKWNR